MTNLAHNVKWLEDEVESLQSSISYAGAKQVDNPMLHMWIASVEQVANEADVMIERVRTLREEKNFTFMHRVSSYIWKKEGRLDDISNDIESLKERVNEIKKRRDENQISETLENLKLHRTKLLRTTPSDDCKDVIGFEEDFQTLLRQLGGKDPGLKMVSIHGMGGLGKTTLARKLYNCSALSHFQTRAWVCVSQTYDFKDVLIRLIKSIRGNERDLLGQDEDDLLKHLQEVLQDGDGYLAVIDDIWDIEIWEKIKQVFRDSKNAGRVIITTRNKEIALGLDDRCFVHELGFLSKDESCQLFCTRAKPDNSNWDLGEEMVAKCGGLPLAIVVLGGLLYRKSYDDWSRVKDDIWRQLKNKTGDPVKIDAILSLSYHDLSSQLKKCFLYLARFPEDHTFEVHKLKLLWIAEGFISESVERDGVVMEDVADDYIAELINRNLMKLATVEMDGEVSECQLHDLVRDLAIQKAMECRLLGTFDSHKQDQNPDLLKGVSRHAINNGVPEYLKLLGPSTNSPELGSLTVIVRDRAEAMDVIEGVEENEEIIMEAYRERVRLIYTSFKNLKVLDLNHIEAFDMPKEIGDLVFLKFLGLTCGTYFFPLEVPATIGKLKRLQTLCGFGGSTYGIPIEIFKLKELRHFNVRDYYLIGKTSSRLCRNQTKLQTLCTIDYSAWIKIDTVNLSNLRILFISDRERDEKDGDGLESLANITSLQSLSLKFGDIPTIKPLSSLKNLKKVSLEGRMQEDASDLRYLPDSVTDLTLDGCELRQDPMPTLGCLSNLVILTLKDSTYWGEKMVCSPNSFPSLQFLRVDDPKVLDKLQIEDGALPSFQDAYTYNEGFMREDVKWKFW